jgi:hypothetical protein
MAGGKTQASNTPKYTGLQIQTSTEGKCIPIVYGQARVAPNLINTWNFRKHGSGGGKGGGKGGGGKGCFAGGTLVTMVDGPPRKLSGLAVGDQVLSFNPETGETGAGTISEVHVHAVVDTGDDFLLVALEDGTVIKPTSNHYFWRHDGERVEIGDYTIGETLIGEHGEMVTIDAIEEAEPEVFSYNLTVEPHHNFYVEGILAHNGGGGGGSKQTTYSAGVTLAICEGPIAGVLRVFKDQSIVTLASLGFTLFTGSGDQGSAGNFNTGFSALSGHPAAAPAADMTYRWTAYVNNQNYDLGPSPTLPQHNFEIGSTFTNSIAGTPDCDPSDVIYDMLTNDRYGLGMPPSAIGDRTAFSSYCRAQGLLFSPVLDSQEQVISILQRWAQLTNSWIFWSENKLKFVPLGDSALTFDPLGPLGDSEIFLPGNGYSNGDVVTVTGGSGDATLHIDSVNSDSGAGAIGAVLTYSVVSPGTSYGAAANVPCVGGTGSGFTIDIYQPGAASYTPNITPVYALTYEDFQSSSDEPPIKVTRSDPADGYNWVKVEISARDREYNTSTIEWKDQTSIDLYGLLQAQDVQAKEICDRNAANVIASLVGKRAIYIRNTYTFRLSYNFVLLEPGDLVTLTDPAIGLDNFPVRIQSLDEDDQGTLSVVAEEFPAGIGTPAIYSSQGWEGVLPPSVDVAPGPINPPAIVEPPGSVTQGVAQIWFGLSGGVYWGGAQVWASIDDVTYLELGEVDGASAQGVLLSTLASHADPDTADTLAVDLSMSRMLLSSAVTHADADAGRMLALVGDELVGFGAVVPGTFSSYAYDLTYLRRGFYASPIGAHTAGTLFTALDPNVMLQVNLPKDYVGRTVYLKFPSFNVYGGGLEDISTVTRYTYVPVGPVYSIAGPGAVTLADTTGAGVTISLTASWGASTGPDLASYEVQFSVDGGSTWTGPDVVVGASATTYTLTSAAPVTHYQARVRATNISGKAQSGWSVSNIIVTGALPVIPSGGVTALPLVNGDIPIGLMADQFGAMILVAQ